MVCLLIALSGLSAAEGMNEPDDAGAHQETGPDGEMEPVYKGETCQEKAERAYMFGVFSEELPVIEGRFVSFSFEDGSVYNYTIINEAEELIFNSIIIEGFVPESEPKMDGAVFRMNGTDSDIWIHNNPHGMLQVTTSEHEAFIVITAELADDLSLIKLTNGTYEIEGLSVPAYLRIGAAGIDINGSTVIVDISGNGHFMFTSISGKSCGSSEYRYKYTMALMNGSIDSELHIVSSKGETLMQKFEYRGMVQMKVRSLEKNRIRIIVESEEHKGKVVGINVDKDTLNAKNSKEIAVMLDGEGMKKASGVEEVLGAEGDEGVYWIVESPEGMQALIYVPSFSEHEITLENTGEIESAVLLLSNLATILIALVILGILVYGTLRVKKQD